MKKIRLIALAMVIVLMAALACSCGAKEEIEVPVNVKVVGEDKEVLLDTAVLVKSSKPTVLMAIIQACQEADISIEDDGYDPIAIAGVEETEDDEYLYFWDGTLDGKNLEAKAANTELTIKPEGEKDWTIVYTYSSIEKTITDEEGNVVTDEE